MTTRRLHPVQHPLADFGTSALLLLSVPQTSRGSYGMSDNAVVAVSLTHPYGGDEPLPTPSLIFPSLVAVTGSVNKENKPYLLKIDKPEQIVET